MLLFSQLDVWLVIGHFNIIRNLNGLSHADILSSVVVAVGGGGIPISTLLDVAIALFIHRLDTFGDVHVSAVVIRFAIDGVVNQSVSNRFAVVFVVVAVGAGGVNILQVGLQFQQLGFDVGHLESNCNFICKYLNIENLLYVQKAAHCIKLYNTYWTYSHFGSVFKE